LPAAHRSLLLFVAALIDLVGCDAASSANSREADTPNQQAAEIIVSCEPWERVPIEGTKAVLVNNVWNEQWANGQAHSQCLRKQPEAGGFRYGWRWEWPAYRPYSSYAAPEALIGWKAWDGGSSTTTELPKRLAALRALKLGFGVEVAADATYNLNATMWLTRSDVAKAEIDPTDITNEVMVWFKNPGGLGGGGESDGTVTLGGLTFDVSHIVNHSDDSGGTPHTWTMVTYISQTDADQADFDLNLVLLDVVQKGLAESSFAVGGVELITEIFGGAGSLWLDRFDVTVETL
jgi:Glycosyl hydrolase family 12